MTDAERLLSRETFRNERFEDLELPAADLTGKDFSGCTFRRVKLPESRWEGAHLEECLFEDCDLGRLRPVPRVLAGVTFRRCRLQGVEWSGLRNPTLRFEACDLRHGAFLDLSLRGAAFLGCRAGEATFSGCDLGQADFSGSDLTGAVLEGCTLAQADLRDARGAFPDPARNRVKDARVSLETAARIASAMGMLVDGFEG